METKCLARNAAGEPCQAHVREGDAHCRWHDPARADDRRAWRKKGGENKSNLARLKKAWGDDGLTPSEIGGLLSAAMIGAFNGDVEASTLSALAGAARALIAVRESSDAEARIAALEAASGVDAGRLA